MSKGTDDLFQILCHLVPLTTKPFNGGWKTTDIGIEPICRRPLCCGWCLDIPFMHRFVDAETDQRPHAAIRKKTRNPEGVKWFISRCEVDIRCSKMSALPNQKV